MLQMDSALKVLRAQGMRVTPQRRAVIAALADNTSHPSTDQLAAVVQERVPGISLSTIYATLHELAELGLVRRVDAPGAMRFDPETAPHAHLSCIECGAVIDVDMPTEVLESVALAAGITSDCVEVVVRSVCSACCVDLTSPRRDFA